MVYCNIPDFYLIAASVHLKYMYANTNKQYLTIESQFFLLTQINHIGYTRELNLHLGFEI